MAGGAPTTRGELSRLELGCGRLGLGGARLGLFSPAKNLEVGAKKNVTERHRKSIYNIILEIYKIKNFA